ncbi:D-alanyl-D-alanine carboxypeptidase family protein [Treponema sp. J25]|uniref:D-alanyl-D-alanine carboxypeptidase family protein n=1 Tax=Treponema sp. J25 TaxID=2094121 RepID=UPI0010518C16|nr:D-alanyl-D-alanine carboxypeptidase family protein [Treponema sp. J25]TCW62657.1 D-alanyl-D-alanine carboxypeptidase [Treponema sp. J25]
MRMVGSLVPWGILVGMLLFPWETLRAEKVSPVPSAPLEKAENFLSPLPFPIKETPLLQAGSAILIDATTGKILYEKNADLSFPPASLTKLVTMYRVLEAIQEGKTSLKTVLTPPQESWAINQPAGSSLMFLGPGQRVSVEELLLGLAVASGNDAAVALAIHIDGSVPAFVQGMNRLVKTLGLEQTFFVEPAGISAENRTTARDFVRFCAAYINIFPEALSQYHRVTQISYPLSHNLSRPAGNTNPIIQQNRNGLLGQFEGVDGLKTGYIQESGYNMAVTARRGNTRLLAVLLGGPGRTTAEGSAIREQDSRTLLEWGFSHFTTLFAHIEHLEPVRVWKGKVRSITPQVGASLAFTVPRERASGVHWELNYQEPLIAPLPQGTPIGRLRFFDATGTLYEVPLISGERVEKGPWWRRIMDTCILFFKSLFRS